MSSLASAPEPVVPMVRRRPPLGLVVCDSHDEPEIDWSAWYLEEPEDGNHIETPEHFSIGDVFHSSIDMLRWRRQGVFANECSALIMRNTGFSWIQHDERVQVSPDVYVMFDPPAPLPRLFMTWLSGHKAPDLALEVVSDERAKEYDVNPDKYASLGAQELVIYDPRRFGSKWKGEEVDPLQRYVRRPDRAFERTESGQDRVFCRTLGVWLISLPSGNGGYQLRMSLDREGRELVPTMDEALTELRVALERERADKG